MVLGVSKRGERRKRLHTQPTFVLQDDNAGSAQPPCPEAQKDDGPDFPVVQDASESTRNSFSGNISGNDTCRLSRMGFVNANHLFSAFTTEKRLRLHRVQGVQLSCTDPEQFAAFTAALHRNCFCALMEGVLVRDLAWHAELYEFLPNTEVVLQGEQGTHFFVVVDGSFCLSVDGTPVRGLGPGDTFGEMGLVHQQRQWATISAVTEGKLWGIEAEAFLSVLRRMSEIVCEENVELLGRTRILRYLDKFQRKKVCRRLVAHIYEEGSVISIQGTKHNDCMWVVKSGTLEVKVDGKRVMTLNSGQLFGEQALLYSEPRSATLTALNRSVVLPVSRRELERVRWSKRGDLTTWSFEHLMWHEVVFHSIGSLAKKKPELFSHRDAQAVADAFIIRDFLPQTKVVGEHETKGMRFVVVLKGEVVVRSGKEEKFCTRMQWFGEEYLANPSAPFEHSILAKGEEPCKLAILTSEAVAALAAAEGETQLNHAQKMALVRKPYIFRHLSNHHASLIANSFRMLSKRKGENIVEEGSLGSDFFVIESGECVVVVKGPPEKKIRNLGVGDYFGERGMLYDEPRTATVTCQSDEVRLMVIHKNLFMEIVEERMLKHLEERIRLQQTDVTLAELRMLSVVGRGTFGVVKLVEHRSRGTRYALKCINRAEAERSGQQANLKQEREILMEVDHPFILKAVKTFKDASSLYFLTEVVSGGELYETIRVLGLLTKPQAQFYSGSIVLALEWLHDRSIVYRDLKPENVLLDSQGFVKLIDFGCAIKLRNPTFSIVGTPHYMAPEVILGNGYGTSCDVWSLGVCTYEFICGPLPFGSDTEDHMEIFREVLSAKLCFPPHLADHNSIQLLRQALCRALDRRIGSGRSMLRAVRKHPFFSDFSFDRLLSRHLEPPFVPDEPEYDTLSASVEDKPAAEPENDNGKDDDSSSGSALSSCYSPANAKAAAQGRRPSNMSAADDWHTDF